jgi:hypothetical protein
MIINNIMRKLISLLLLILSLSANSFAQKEKNGIEAGIAGFFDGLSLIDSNKIKANATADFMLLEDGEVWNMDTLLSKVYVRKNSGIVRVNRFEFIKTEQQGNFAWVSYYNYADFSMNEKKQSVKWLESAVLKKEGNAWKIKLLHSTRILPPKQK